MEDTYKHKGLRASLIKNLQRKGITDLQVLNAIANVPRHLFMDSAFLAHAYQDKPFAIGEGQTISQPYTVAIQTTLLKLQPGLKTLEIGTGSGYQAAVILEMGARLFSIEFHPKLYRSAKLRLEKLGYNCNLICGDGSSGLPAHAPFDRILVTAGAQTIPNALIDQLAIGGILVIPVGDENSQEMVRIEKTGPKSISKGTYGNFRFVKLVGKEGWK